RWRSLSALVLVTAAGFLWLFHLFFGSVAASLPFRKSQDHFHWTGTTSTEPETTTGRPTTRYPPTTIPSGAHAHGYTLFDHMYLRNGTFYVVTANRSAFPPIPQLLAPPHLLGEKQKQDAGDAEIRFISPEDAQGVLGKMITRVEGISIVVYDPAEYAHHFYHWFGEILFGFWRVYSHILMDSSKTERTLDFPRKIILPFMIYGEWRDSADIDGPFTRTVFPNTGLEFAEYWHELARLGTTVVFDRMGLLSRISAHNHPLANHWGKMMAGTMELSAPPDFWAPIREAMWQNMLGWVPGSPTPAKTFQPGHSSKPVVTYVPRQRYPKRKLRDADHETLLVAMRELEREGLCEFQVAENEVVAVQDQIAMASRTTIMLGVHGNGLTHELWMPPSPQSTIIEIFSPQGYVYDYELLARNLGHKHYAIWNDTYITYEPGIVHEGTHFPLDFQAIEKCVICHPSDLQL
ncbi:unnamed protein product, partial [Mycena citricolor]